jgi:hypothetical protein
VGTAGDVGDPLGGQDQPLAVTAERGPRLLRSVLQRPAVAVVLLLALLALLAERAVLTPGDGLLQGGRLLPVPDGASDLWAAYASTWSSTGPGSPAPAPPRVAVLAALSTLLLGKPWLAVDLVLLAGVPLAGLTAYVAARRLVASRVLRAWAAITWALLPVPPGRSPRAAWTPPPCRSPCPCWGSPPSPSCATTRAAGGTRSGASGWA